MFSPIEAHCATNSERPWLANIVEQPPTITTPAIRPAIRILIFIQTTPMEDENPAKAGVHSSRLELNSYTSMTQIERLHRQAGDGSAPRSWLISRFAAWIDHAPIKARRIHWLDRASYAQTRIARSRPT